MQLTRSNRWSLAFADLSLLLLGFMALLNLHPEQQHEFIDAKQDGPELQEFEILVSDMFEPGEAMIGIVGEKRISEILKQAGHRNISYSISISGHAEGSARLDSWELSAARMASVGRSIERTSASDTKIDFVGPILTGDGQPQKILMTAKKPDQEMPPL